jgi:hypothetical protein
MKRVLVRYKLKPDRVEENEKAVRAVFAQLAETKPGGLRYATFKQGDGVSFVHIAEHGDSNPLLAVAAFKEFAASVKDRCEEPPIAFELTEIGTYRFFE